LQNAATPNGYASIGIISMDRTQWGQLQTNFSLANNDSVFIESIMDRIDLQNMTNMTQIVEMYELFVRKDSGINSTAPDVTYIVGLQNQGLSTTASTYPVFTPFDSNLFTQTYKINRVRKITLKIGDRRQFQFTRKPNKKFEYSFYTNNSSVHSYRDWTKYYLFLAYGTPISHTESNPEPPPINTRAVNNGPVSVNITHFVKVNLRISQVSQNQSRSSDNRPILSVPHEIVVPAYTFTSPVTNEISTIPTPIDSTVDLR